MGYRDSDDTGFSRHGMGQDYSAPPAHRAGLRDDEGGGDAAPALGHRGWDRYHPTGRFEGPGADDGGLGSAYRHPQDGERAPYGPGRGGAPGRPRGGWQGDGPRERQRSPQQDPDYDRWRQEQLRLLDEDYHAWRQERYQKFSDDFNTWRASRTAGGASPSAPGGSATRSASTATGSAGSAGSADSTATHHASKDAAQNAANAAGKDTSTT